MGNSVRYQKATELERLKKDNLESYDLKIIVDVDNRMPLSIQILLLLMLFFGSIGVGASLMKLYIGQ